MSFFPIHLSPFFLSSFLFIFLHFFSLHSHFKTKITPFNTNNINIPLQTTQKHHKQHKIKIKPKNTYTPPSKSTHKHTNIESKSNPETSHSNRFAISASQSANPIQFLCSSSSNRFLCSSSVKNLPSWRKNMWWLLNEKLWLPEMCCLNLWVIGV
ncbi:unnamed protein product [Trifolium pratense]|uniref:Uncharacterized protein n=1 Tax=Trifolium pratense TaxID=57577 RepID=A0ACB0I6D9_TRIPR|nr:unnamed protein product [Trifolium pratense]